MKIILALLLLSLSANSQDIASMDDSVDAQDLVLLRGRILKRQVENGRLTEKIDKTIEKMVDVSEWQLHLAGADHVGRQIRQEYENQFRDYLQLHFVSNGLSMHGIGDHPEYILSLFLDSLYNKLQDVLGYQLMRIFHLTDIKSLNWGIKLCLSPVCSNISKEEYAKHFVGGFNNAGEFYDGVLPVVSYWLTQIVCDVVTWGSGAFLICSPVAQIVEMGVENFIAPSLSDKIYEKLCPTF